MSFIENVIRGFHGVVPSTFARNGRVADGAIARAIARQLNMLVARSGIAIPPKCVPTASVRDTVSDLALWRARYRAGPNGTKLVSRLLCLPSLGDFSAAAYLKIDGVAQTSVRPPVGIGGDLNQARLIDQEIAVTAGATHEVELWTKHHARVVSWTLYEKERDTLDAASDTVIDYTTIAPLSPILAADLTAMIVTVAHAIYNKLRGQAFAWNADDPASPVAIVGGSAAANIWGDSACTIPVPTRYRDSYMTDLTGAQIPCVCWAYAKRTAGAGNGTITFKTPSQSTTLTVNSGTAAFYATTTITNLLLTPQVGDDSTEVQAAAPAGTNFEIYACGAYPLIGT